MRNQVFKKLFSVLLALIMVAGLLPASAMAGGWGAMDVDTTPELTETEQPTESAEPTAPTETETPEVTEVPEPTPENPAATVEPTQGEPTAEPTEGITIAPVNEVVAQAANTETDTPFTIDETVAKTRENVGKVNYRAVMLDCGRKYFSVDNIKKLIDTMAQYGYNQLQLSFGNGGCRFLLNDMKLVFTDASGATVTLDSDDVENGIKAGNWAFNGDESVLTEAEMTEIISYANSKKIAIVPMLNMPGHMNWLKASFSGYASGKELDKLDIEKTTARNFGYALLNKYVQYFKEKCEFFHFGADESDYTGDNMTKFLTGCANVIVGAGMIPRAFNDSTRDASMPKSVQVTYWINANYIQSKNASVLDNEGYELINTHGRWYYVVNSGDADDTKSVQYANNVTVELPMLKKDKQGSWPNNLRTYFDYNNSTVSEKNHKGTMFCIWCDNSTGMPAEEIISTESYGALTQLQELAKLYWPGDITTDPETTPTPTPTPDQTNGDTVNVELVVGDETNGSKTFDVVGEITTNSNEYIATATVAQGAAVPSSVKEVTQITSGKSYLIYNNRYGAVLTTDKSTAWGGNTDGLELKGAATIANVSESNTWVITGADGSYTVKSAKGYMTIGSNTSGYADSETKISLVYTNGGYWNISYNGYYLNNLGESAQTGGWNNATQAPSDAGSKWTIYEITEASDGGSKLTITATGEGDTTVKVGNTTYNITVTAPEKTETVQLAPSGTFTLPEGATDVATSGDNVITVSGTTVTAGQTDGTATVAFVTKNEGDKITAKYTYTFNVSAIDWSIVDDLPVELWVTNLPIGKDATWDGSWNGLKLSLSGTTTICTPATIKIKAQDVNAAGADGMLLSSQVPESGVSYGQDTRNNKIFVKTNTDGTNTEYRYWKGVVLHNGMKQYHANGSDTNDRSDRSGAGTNFELIRYMGDKWQYCDTAGNWHDVLDDDTLIAYYMQKFVVSSEITTLTRDWGDPAHGEAVPGWGSATPLGFMGTGFAVVYPGGRLNRTEAEIYETMMVRYASNAGTTTPGVIAAWNNSDYIVEKITITRGINQDVDTRTSEGKKWNIGDTVKWDKVAQEDGTEWYDETIVWKADEANSVNAITVDIEKLSETDANGGWYAKNGNEAFLILIYLKALPKESNLNVVYWDDNANMQINQDDIQIVVEENVTYLNGLYYAETMIGGQGPWTGKTPADNNYLPDDAYVTNSSNEQVKFNKDLPRVPKIAANYRSGIYEYVGANISEDGKTLTLHYNLKKFDDVHQFVVDFGLPVTFTNLLSWFKVSNAGTVEYLSVAKGGKLTESTGSWGSIKIDETTWDSMTYTLDKMLSAKATIPLYCNLKEGKQQLVTQIEIIPATNVYYEDSFAKFTDGSDNGSPIEWITVTDGTTQNANTAQALEALGNKTYVYGYDPKYDSCTMFSMGSAHKVTVTSDMATTGVVWPTAQFTFKGTGFDIISLTNNTSGAIFVFVYKGTDTSTTSNRVRSHIVDNYYGYKQDENGNWVVDKENNNALYQIPVMRIRGLEYGEYTAVVKVFYDNAFDHTATGNSYSFWLDAVRVYDPMGESVNTGETYKPDGEAYPQYIKLRDELANNGTVGVNDKLLFIDGAANATIDQYKNLGPNNEVYLANGQAITFKLAGTDLSKIETVQIGAKSPNSNGTKNANMVIGSITQNLNTATEMYYDITEAAKTGNAITVTNNGDAILSLTNLKITFNAQGSVSLGAMNAEEQAASVMAVRALFAPAPVEPEPEPEPEKTFEPERFEASWSRNVMQGRKATLTVKTSEDVEAITVDGQTIRSYRTRTERVGFGRRAKRITYREFTYSMVAQESADFSVTAINAEGTESEAITARLTVKTRPNSMRDMWDWFKGWF